MKNYENSYFFRMCFIFFISFVLSQKFLAKSQNSTNLFCFKFLTLLSFKSDSSIFYISVSIFFMYSSKYRVYYDIFYKVYG